MLYKNLCDKGVLLAIYLLLINIPAWSQIYLFEQISLEDGLPNNRINDMIEDSRGFYWFATDGTGLVRYDGYEFSTFSNEEETDLFIYNVDEDNSGRIWAGQESGLLLFDGKKFIKYILPRPHKLKEMTLGMNGEVFVLTQEGKLISFDDEIWQQLDSPAEPFNDLSGQGSAIALANAHAIFTLAENNIVLLDSVETRKVEVFQDSIYAITDSAVFCYTLKGNKVGIWNNELQYLDFSHGFITAINTSNNLIIKPFSGTRPITSENGLPNLPFKGCYRDSYGVVWLFGTNGLVKLETMALELYNDDLDKSLPLINTVHIGENGSFYGGYSQGVLKLENRNVKYWNKDHDFPFGLTLAIEEYNGDLWFATEGGLVRNSNNSFTSVKMPDEEFGGFVFTMKSANGKLFIGSGTELLAFSEGRFNNISRSSNLPPASIYSISKAKLDSSIWCATYTQGFFRWSNNYWEVLKSLNGVSLDSLRFSCFVAVSKNEIWAASLTEGLFHISKNGIEQIPLSALGFAEVNALAIDEYQNLWASSNKGLLKISEDRSVYNLSESLDFNGLPNEIQAMDLKDGNLLLATLSGLQLLKIDEYLGERKEPKIALTGMKLFLKEGSTLYNYAADSIPFSQLPKGLELPHHLNFLSFNIAGLSSYEQDKLRYRFRLKGESDNWTFAGKRREAVWSSLEPGKYVFEAQVQKIGEQWSNNPLTYSFVILRPIWQRWWFISLFILLFVGTSIYLIRLRIQRIRNRLQLENNLLDMERKALRLQMNPHFIFNALDSISSFIFKNDPQKAVRYLNNFAKLMRLTLESSMEHLHPVETEVSILKNYLELEKLRFQGKFDYSIDLDDEIDYDIGIPPMLIQPHVENAILHGLKPMASGGKLELRFELNDDDDMLIIEIEDNGIGRQKAKEFNRKKDHRSMATQINEDRIRLLKMSKNEKIDIAIIDKKDEKEQALGTLVVIKLPAENI